MDAKGPAATAVSRLAVRSKPGVRSGMRRSNRKKPAGPATTQAGSAAGCTSEQQETMQQGLRILARIIARAHLERQAEPREPEPTPELEAGG